MYATHFGDLSTEASAVADAESQFSDLPSVASEIVAAYPAMQNFGGAIIASQTAASAAAVRAANAGRADIQQLMQAQIQALGTLDTLLGTVLDEIDQLDAGFSFLGLDSSGNALPGAVDESSMAPPMVDITTDDTSSLGQIDWASPYTIAGALALGVAIWGVWEYVQYQKAQSDNVISAQNKVLDSLGAGKVTAAQASTMLSTLAKTQASTTAAATGTGIAGVESTLKGLAIPAAVVAVAFLVMPELKRMGKV